MKVFRCGDVLPGCNREFLGVDREAVLTQVAAHGRDDHGLQVDDALVALVEAHLREEPDPPA